ncbi:RNA-binding protein 6 [Varanus komodoensis]|nr:RNA-binding protein 6 [Varanus komodoensis]
MRKAELDESQVGIKISGRNINNLRYADDTTLMAESEEELNSLLMQVKEESAKVGLKLNIKKTKITASGPLTSWQIDGEEMEVVTDFIFLGSKITADGDCSQEIKRRLLLGRKAMANLDSILKIRDIMLPTKVRIVKAMVFPVVMYGCESWTIRKTECRRIEAFALRRPDAEDETQIIWSPNEKEGCPGEEPNAGNNRWQKKKGTAEDECKLSTVGYRSSCYFCKLPRDVTEEKLEKGEEALSEEPAPEEELLKEPIPEQETAPQKPMSEQQCQPQEPEAKKKDDIREQWPSQERKRDFEMYSPRKENQERGSRKATEAKHQEDESKTIMLKRIPRFTPPEVIVGLLAPYVRLSTSSVRVMKNKAGRMGYTYGFIELDSHAEALRLVKVLQNLDPPISIDGRPVDVNLATGKRRNEYGDQGDNPRFSQGKRGMSDRRGGDSQKRKSESSSDVSTFIYDPDTGNYFDPISGVYYDPNTQREVPMGREASISPPPSSGRRHKSQERTSERDDTSSRDNRERRDRHRNKSAKNESQEEKFPAEDVFKKPLPPVLKKEESTPPFNMALHGKELSEDLKKIIVALHKDGLSYKKTAKTLKLSCSTVAKTIQRFNRTGSTQNRPRHGRPKKVSARAQHHIQRLALGNRRMSAASIAAEVEGVVGQPVSAQTIRRTLHQIGLQGCRPRRKPLLKMMHKKARKQFAEDKQTTDMD